MSKELQEVLKKLSEMEGTEDTFSQAGLSVGYGQAEVGKTYPFFGMITEILEEGEKTITCSLNGDITLVMNHPEDKFDIFKDRMFETGIFISTITKKDDEGIVAVCKTVIYGRKQEMGSA